MKYFPDIDKLHTFLSSQTDLSIIPGVRIEIFKKRFELQAAVYVTFPVLRLFDCMLQLRDINRFKQVINGAELDCLNRIILKSSRKYVIRSEQPRVGKESVSTCRARC